MKFDYHLILKQLLGEESLYPYFYEELLHYISGGILDYEASTLDATNPERCQLYFDFGEEKTVSCMKENSQYQVMIQEGDFYSKRISYQKDLEDNIQDEHASVPTQRNHYVTKNVEEHFFDSKSGLQKMKERVEVEFSKDDPDIYREMSYTRTVVGYDAQVCQLSEIGSAEEEPRPYILPDLQDSVQITRTNFSDDKDLASLLANGKEVEVLIPKSQERISNLQDKLTSFAPRYFVKLK